MALLLAFRLVNAQCCCSLCSVASEGSRLSQWLSAACRVYFGSSCGSGSRLALSQSFPSCRSGCLIPAYGNTLKIDGATLVMLVLMRCRISGLLLDEGNFMLILHKSVSTFCCAIKLATLVCSNGQEFQHSMKLLKSAASAMRCTT